jgi:hypothetical protein
VKSVNIPEFNWLRIQYLTLIPIGGLVFSIILGLIFGLEP